MIYRTLIGVAAFFLLAASVSKAQTTNTFTITQFANVGCSSLKGSASAVSGVCTAYTLDDVTGFVKSYMAPNSTTNYQFFLYTDSACTNLFTTGAGTCNTCTPDKTTIICPTAYVAPSSMPSWPTVSDGFTQLTKCFDSSCAGSSCTISAIKTGSCIAQTNDALPAIKAVATSCSADTFTTAFFTDTSCGTVAASTKEKSLGCVWNSKNAYYRKYGCATANTGSVTISTPSGFSVTYYNTTATSTCSGASISETNIANGLCTSSDSGYQTIKCVGTGSATINTYSDNQCTISTGSFTGPLSSACSKGQIVTCTGSASSLVVSAASMFMVGIALFVQRLF